MAALDEAALVQFRLTGREAEGLTWVADDKTDRDLATLLECSPRTLHKHLQRVCRKLSMETRTRAVMRALARD